MSGMPGDDRGSPESRYRESRPLKSTGVGLGSRAQGMTGVSPMGRYKFREDNGP